MGNKNNDMLPSTPQTSLEHNFALYFLTSEDWDCFSSNWPMLSAQHIMSQQVCVSHSTNLNILATL